jgi:hypothetical protein
MSVRKRTWKTAGGEERQAWLCDYNGQSGKRHVKTFARKKDVDAFIAKAKVDVREGVHTADSDVTIRDAALGWQRAGDEGDSADQIRFQNTPKAGDAIGEHDAVDPELHVGVIVADMEQAARRGILRDPRCLQQHFLDRQVDALGAETGYRRG